MNDKCRLCGGNLSYKFQKKQLSYRVAYFACESCHSLQTEKPYWLEEAYKDLNFSKDTGMVSRTLYTARLLMAFALLESFDRNDVCIDFGSGTGLLTRLLRDVGLNAFCCDKYCENIFSIGFEKKFTDLEMIKMVSVFEVLEHLSEPLRTLDGIFSQKPEYVFCSTKIYKGQGVDWWYLLNDGQHVQFYSLKSLELVAKYFGYFFQSCGGTYHLFSRDPFHPKLLKRIIKKADSPYLQSRCQKMFSSRIEEDHQKMMLIEK